MGKGAGRGAGREEHPFSSVRIDILIRYQDRLREDITLYGR